MGNETEAVASISGVSYWDSADLNQIFPDSIRRGARGELGRAGERADAAVAPAASRRAS